MDKVKQNIIQQQQLDKFNIEKSVVGTEAYYINQDIQKGMSQDEIIEKARSGVYKLTAENKKAGRVGQRYGESKKENDTGLTVESIHNSIQGNNFWLKPDSKEAKIVNQAIKEGYLRRTSHTQVEWKDQAAIDKLKNSKESTDKKEGKSKAASKVLQLMDSEPDGELHYGKYVSQVVKEMGVNREELEKELDKYI